MYQDDINKKVDLGTKNKQDGDSIRVSFSKINSMTTELYANDAELDGRVTTNTNNIANHEIRLGDLEGMTLTADQAAQEIYIRNAQGILIDKLSVAFLNNEGTTFVYNEVNETLDLKNDAGTILASVPVSAFVSNLAKSISLNYNVLTLKDTEGNALSSVELNIDNIAGLQTALDDASNQDNNIVKMLQIPTDQVTTQDEVGIVEYINNLSDAEKVTISKDEILVVEFVEPKVFTTLWYTSNNGVSASNEVLLPMTLTGACNITVDWGDGTVETFTDYDSMKVPHTYATAGYYTIKMSGRVEGFEFMYNSWNGYNSDSEKLIEVTEWGGLVLGDSTFYGCEFADFTNVSDIPDLSTTTSLSWTFSGCYNMTKINRLEEWDISNITLLEGTFEVTENWVGQDLSAWNTSNVTSLGWMFSGSAFDHPSINEWDVSNVTNLDQMFAYTNYSVNGGFSYDLNKWDTSNVTNMNSVFLDAINFNGDVTTWNTSKVTNMRWMFKGTPFNRDITGWDTSSVTNMENMFYSNSVFNQPIGVWNTSIVSNMNGMFRDSVFNQDISSWDVTSLTGGTYSGLHRGFLGNTSFSTANYDALLTSWSQQVVQSGVYLDMETGYSSTSQTARDTLTNDPNNWVITDAGVVA